MNVEKFVLAFDFGLDLLNAIASHFGTHFFGLPITSDHATQLGTLYTVGLVLKHSKAHRWHIKISSLIQWVAHHIEMGRQSVKRTPNHTMPGTPKRKESANRRR